MNAKSKINGVGLRAVNSDVGRAEISGSGHCGQGHCGHRALRAFAHFRCIGQRAPTIGHRAFNGHLEKISWILKELDFSINS